MAGRSSPRLEPETALRAGPFRLRDGAKGLVTSASKVLLVRERHADGTPFWTLPGGGVHRSECPTEGLRRELAEELNCRAHIGRPVTTFWYAHDSLDDTVSAYTVFDCALLSEPDADQREGVFECRWVDPETLPASTLPQVRHVCRHVADLSSPSAASDD
ncbi:NUDIX domain-containing protein [Halomicroarcula sp. F13]|uniref:NUDIX domain-containing protein n=1 Tax=Haloarcula rubra TaxID=2487747 RepID=A0AAW4PQT9_9EURY|nr:NUDIX domain-containing protein [Halomicroarcula rubra]MBX0322672.1 NUDIX domain-containing protein [Halomicroarcula rubra]